MARRRKPLNLAAIEKNLFSHGPNPWGGRNPAYRRAGPGSRTARRAAFLKGILAGRGDLRQYKSRLGLREYPGHDIGAVLGAHPGERAIMGQVNGSPSFRAGYVRGATGSHRNVGSFTHRKGRWAKGKGGRFIGTA